jgi:hypothetical protein
MSLFQVNGLIVFVTWNLILGKKQIMLMKQSKNAIMDIRCFQSVATFEE